MPPHKEIVISNISNCDNAEKIKYVIRIIGRSVMSGANAILMPSFLLCFKVSVMTSVSNGPGDIPAVSPKNAPMSIIATEGNVNINQ